MALKAVCDHSPFPRLSVLFRALRVQFPALARGFLDRPKHRLAFAFLDIGVR